MPHGAGIPMAWDMLIDLLVLSTVMLCHLVLEDSYEHLPYLYLVTLIMESQDMMGTEFGHQVQGSENSSEPREG